MIVRQAELNMVEMQVRHADGVPAHISAVVDSHGIVVAFCLRVIISILNLTYVIGTEHHDELIVSDNVIGTPPENAILHRIRLIVINVQYR